jgi:hypothetical protein
MALIVLSNMTSDVKFGTKKEPNFWGYKLHHLRLVLLCALEVMEEANSMGLLSQPFLVGLDLGLRHDDVVKQSEQRRPAPGIPRARGSSLPCPANPRLAPLPG